MKRAWVLEWDLDCVTLVRLPITFDSQFISLLNLHKVIVVVSDKQ